MLDRYTKKKFIHSWLPTIISRLYLDNCIFTILQKMRQIQTKGFSQKAFGGHVGHQRQQKGEDFAVFISCDFNDRKRSRD